MGTAEHTTAIVVPVRSFSQAKARLGDVIPDQHRGAVMQAMAEAVLRAAQPLAVFVVTADAEVISWANGQGASVVDDPGDGLDGAAHAGVAAAAANGHARAAVIHGDLPLVTDLDPVLGADGVCLVPDRRQDGTNVLTVPTSSPFSFSYGPRSFERHLEEARRHHLDVEVVIDSRLAFDLDTPADVELLREEHPAVADALGLSLVR